MRNCSGSRFKAANREPENLSNYDIYEQAKRTVTLIEDSDRACCAVRCFINYLKKHEGRKSKIPDFERGRPSVNLIT